MGDCAVNVIDENRETHIAYKLLVEGDHFGEIGVVYDCCRTATIVSRNYNTINNLSIEGFRDLVSELPQYAELLKRHIYQYSDPLKIFSKSIITKIPYFGPSFMNKHLFHKILFSFAPRFIEIGNLLLKEGDKVESIFIVQSGTLEIYASFEGNEFIIEKLHRGSVLNYRVIFNGDEMHAGVRATQNTHLLELSAAKLTEIRESDKIYGQKVTMWENQLLRSGRTTPLDYMVGTIGKPSGIERSKKNKNILKNIIYERCLEVRLQKSKP